MIRYVTKQFPGLLTSVDIVYPKELPKEMRVLSPAEQERLMKYLLADMDACKFGVLLALLTGMRIGEICALRWGDINLKDKTIYVHATMQRLKDTARGEGSKTKIVIGSPKSDKSVRTIPMTEQAALLCMQMQTKSRAAFVLTGTSFLGSADSTLAIPSEKVHRRLQTGGRTFSYAAAYVRYTGRRGRF